MVVMFFFAFGACFANIAVDYKQEQAVADLRFDKDGDSINMLEIGQEAPLFSLVDQAGRVHELEKDRGQYVLLFFYPKDFTPGCTNEVCAFQSSLDELKRKGVVVYGISKDSTTSHAKFHEKYKLHYDLLSDPDGSVIAAYEANGWVMTNRISYLIDPSGRICKVYKSVSPKTHPSEVLKDLDSL